MDSIYVIEKISLLFALESVGYLRNFFDEVEATVYIVPQILFLERELYIIFILYVTLFYMLHLFSTCCICRVIAYLISF